ncbi:LOW QUALITY PROTEIN: dnaJ homolog subfamily C member 13-like [Limulus polyphemus]|uniref:LOW QUALITY PROTEIN: dnaJ homolog subfamily C member 13-like n=1 Tax=Limulus polyphemus TaxID=6850 RepID=A0ABM1C5E3_LIMPO|nr:LOW QUALITY PROTEIN: dnaJ homolog subfamily C member 13-like [Limulus polyphemus]
MSFLSENKDVACYFVTKHSWKGKYKRIFSVGTLGISTYNPGTMEITNQWPYAEFVSIAPNLKGQTSNEFIITMKRGKKNDTMKFSSDHRADILTEALRFRHCFAEAASGVNKYNCTKLHWSDKRVPVVLEVNQGSLNQLDRSTAKVIASYDYKDIEGLAPVSGGFVVTHGGFGRMHTFFTDKREELLKKIVDHGWCYIGINIKITKELVNLDSLDDCKFGSYSTDEAITSLCEFPVHKISPRHSDSVKRILGLTESCLIERDPLTYSITTLKPLSEIFAIVRCSENPQMFLVEYVKGQVRTYTSTDRDALLASLLDGVRASGNQSVHVKMIPTDRGQRLGPFTVPVDEEVESWHVKFLQYPPSGWDFAECVFRFNNNVPYSGLLHSVTQDGLFAEKKEKLIQGALIALLEKGGDQNVIDNCVLEAQFQGLRRLVASKIGFATFTLLPRVREQLGMKVVKALKRNMDGVTHAAVDMICALMQPMHEDYDLRQEQLNKTSLLSSKKFMESLLDMFVQHVVSRTLFRLFQHPSIAILKGAGLVMKAIIEEGDGEIAAKMQDLALAEGALPRHLHIALFKQSSDSRLLAVQQLSRHLVALWVTGNPIAMGLLRRIVPPGLLSYLDSTDPAPKPSIDHINVRDNLKLAQDHSAKTKRRTPPSLQVVEKHVEMFLQHWRSRIGLEKEEKLQQRPIVLRKRRERIKTEANWAMFYYQFNQDHSRPDLIWNYKTREELRNALDNEMRAFNMDRDLSRTAVISWNHAEFEVRYSTELEEIKIGEYYLRLLLEEDENDTTGSSYIKKSYEFFNDLYHRFLLNSKVSMRAMCLQAMSIVYGRHHEDIGPFNDTRYIIDKLKKCTDKLERDRLVIFISRLILNRRNVKDVLDSDGIKVLVELLTLAHLHTSRATVPTQTNVIEASPDMMMDTEKEWYYGNVEKERRGPYSFKEMKELWKEGILDAKTRCWAQGMDGWRPLLNIPQLKWCLLATGHALMNESELANQILRLLIQICEYFPSRDGDGAIVRPLPRVKRLLSDAACLPHIVQLLLTFDPILVEKVAVLLSLVMQDNPGMSRLYLTGFFYFILMYTGSNLLPIGQLLQATHASQTFRSEENQSSSIMQRSILGQLLPEAMVCYLENHGAEKFAQIFLGEFDTPEAIWNSEMRRLMIEKIATHIAEFSPRLRSNTKALYQYCSIPVIQYPQLENELFCNIYYLRHLCDTRRFPDWPIKDPVKLLKDVLDAWKQEVEKKPPTLSIEDAYKALRLKHGEGYDESTIRKAYFRLAQKYHPDKNPEGREIFEEVNKAYEFLCSKSSRQTEGPNPADIILILNTQSILFSRYKDELHPYKYAGYPMLIKTIRMETEDEHLFSKTKSLLAAATETAYHTVNCSALNAEELRREGGLELLRDAFSRCVGVLSHSSKPDDLQVQVCSHIASCFAVAAKFPDCRQRISEMPDMIKDLCRILILKHLPHLCSVVVSCVSAFAIDSVLQTHLFQSGVLFHMLLFLFDYDYTLEEGGVECSRETNRQEIANQLAIRSIEACCCLGGYMKDEKATPENPAVQIALRSLLTPYLSRKLSTMTSSEILKILNSNTENPYLIWNNATRAELTEYLRNQQKIKIRTGDCDPSFGAEFVFTVHSEELVIGDIFVRVYNEQPTFPLENPKGFTLDLLDHLGAQAQYLYSLMALTTSNSTLNQKASLQRLKNVETALEALRNVIRNNSGVEIQCIGHFKLLFSLLRLDGCAQVQALAIDVIASVTGNQECVNDIAAAEVLVYLLLVLHSLSNSSSRITVLETLLPLMSNSKLVKEAMTKGAVIYLLNLFCNSTNPQIREQTAELLGKMTSDKLVGPKLRITLNKFLPQLFLDATKDSPEAAVMMFEGVQENPELIWNDESRERLCYEVQRMAEEHYKIQKDNPTTVWKVPEEFSLCSQELHGEVIISGVYLRLFIQNPGWVLRRPRDFFTELLDKTLQLMSKSNPDGELLEMVTTALVSLLQAQPTLLDQVPALGHIPRLLKTVDAQDDAIPKSCLLILHQLANSEACIRLLGQTDCILSMIKAMKRRKDMVGVACEALNSMFQHNNQDLVQQISAVLEKSTIWSEYRDQKHDLFITSTTISGYLPPTASVAGYLTQGTSRVIPSAPPPLEET